MEKIIGIYKILNKINNKFYIGSSINIRKRIKEHERCLKFGIHSNKHLQSAWDKYGSNNFEFIIIEKYKNITNRELRNRETEIIQQTKCFCDEIGYNFIAGGIGTLNTPCSQEKREKISKSNMGKKAWNKGISMTKEQKEKLRKVKNQLYGKKVDIYTILGDYIETLDSIREIHRKYGSGRNTIVDSCRGRIVPKKYIFKYHDRTDPTIENQTFGEEIFLIFDLNYNFIKKFKYIKEVVSFITGTDKRNENMEKKLSSCTLENTICLKDKYIIRKANALDSSNVINELRQLSNGKTKGTNDNSANGEA